MTRRVSRTLLGALALCVVSGVAWLFLAKVLVTRELTGTLEVSEAGAGWSWEWDRAGGGKAGALARNGSWIEFGVGRESLEIECEGVAERAGATFRFWLYRVAPTRAGEKELELKRIVTERDAARVEGRWMANANGAGVVFEGAGPGRLRLDAPMGGVSLLIAKTPDGGKVRVRLGETTREVSTYAPIDERATIEIPSAVQGGGRSLAIEQRLPGYEISGWRLRWPGAGGASGGRGALVDPVVTTRVAGRVVRREAVRVLGREAGANGFEFSTEGAGTLELEAPPGLGFAGHVRGWLGVLRVVLVGAVVLALGAWVAGRARARALSIEVVAFGLVVGAHAWLAWWAPLVYCPDSVDYIAGAIDWAEGRASLARFDRFRLPGYPAFAGAIWKVWPGEAFNVALGGVQCVLGIATAALAWLIARRFMPRAWAAAALLMVGLNPVLLAWERFAMSEALSAFLTSLAMYLSVLFVAPRGALQPGERWEAESSAEEAGNARGHDARGLGRTLSDRGTRMRARAVLLAVAIGLTAATGAWVRGNLQLLVPACPALVLVLAWGRWGARRAVLLAGAAFLAGVLPLVPRIVTHQREHGMAGFTIGSSFSHFIFGEPNGVIELNQTGVFEHGEWADVRDDRATGKANEWSLVPRLMGSKRLIAPEGSRGFGSDEMRYRALAEESFSRLGDRRGRLARDAFLNVMGLCPWDEEGIQELREEPWDEGMYPWHARIGFRENETWTRPLRGIDATRGTNFFTDEGHAARHGTGGEAMNRYCRKDIRLALRRIEGKVFADWFQADRIARPVLAGLCVLGAIGALWRREWGMAWVSGLVLAHAGALAWLMLAGLDRYGVVMEPALRIAAAYAMMLVVRWWASAGAGARRTA